MLCNRYHHYVAVPKFSLKANQFKGKTKEIFRVEFLRKKKNLLLTLSCHRSQESKTIKFCTIKVKVKFTQEQATIAQGDGE
jgi:hypothetical protein